MVATADDDGRASTMRPISDDESSRSPDEVFSVIRSGLVPAMSYSWPSIVWPFRSEIVCAPPLQPIQLRLGDVAAAREVDDRDVVGRDLTLLSVDPDREARPRPYRRAGP